MSIFTSHLSASNGAQLTGSVRLTEEATKAASLNFVKDSTTIIAGDNLGSVIFSGRDGGPAIPGQDFIIGAAIAATASANWVSNYQQATNLQFWVQSDEVGDNFDHEAFLTLSGTNGTAQFTGDVISNNKAIAQAGLQSGVSVDGAYADNGGYPVRVSSNTGDVGIELDASNSSSTTSLLFNYGGNSTSGKPGIFVNPGSDADFSIRNEGTAQENGAIMINSTMNSVRIGGGDFGTDAYDGQAALVVSSSQNNRKSWVMVRSRYGEPTTNNSPVLSFDYNSTPGNENTGAWNIGVSNLTTETSSPKQLPLRISSEGVASSQLLNRAVAMTIAEGGSNTSVGIGGNSSSTWPAGSQLPRSMTPTGSLHIEHMNTTTNQLTADLTKANLLLGNSAAGGTSVFSQLAFDVSSDFNPSKHTANITVSKDQTSSEGHMSFRMYDESGNDSSTRPRIRIDGQGGIIMLSGSNPISAGGWPVVNNTNYVVGSNVPSGSLTLLAAKVPGAGGWNAPTLNLVTWGSSTHSSPGISAGDSLGRIQWWSSDSELSDETERVGAYIEATASETHDGSTFSVADLDFYTRNTGEHDPELRLKIASDGTAGFTGDIVAGNAKLTNIQNMAGQNVISTDSSNTNASFSSNITVGATSPGVIYDHNGDPAISLPGNGKVDLTNSYSGTTAAGLEMNNTNTSLNAGGFIQVSKTVTDILNGETLGGILFAGAESGVSTTPNASAKIIAVTKENWNHNVAQGTELQFHTTDEGATSALLTAEISRQGVTGSVGGLKLMAGGIELNGLGVAHITRGGQICNPGLKLLDYSSNDVSVFRVDASDAGHGYTLVYSGSGSGTNNRLELWADDTATGANQQKIAYSIDNAANMHIHQALLGTDPADMDENPSNPALVIAGRRESKVINFEISSAGASTTYLLPAGFSSSASEIIFTSADQGSGTVNQWKYADIMPSDGYIESITLLGDAGCGPASDVTSSGRMAIEVYRQSAGTQTDLSSLSIYHTWSVRYGYANGIFGSAAGTVKTIVIGDSSTFMVAPGTRADTAFLAGDKLWFSWNPGATTTTWKYEDASTASGAEWQLKINYVFDDRNLDT
jgi:hypothetical protein